ncbi:hypothetical protein EMIT0158MI4_10574 [Burkholderia ambifaria]
MRLIWPREGAGLGDVKPGKYTPSGKVGLDSILPAAAQAAASAARRRARRIVRARGDARTQA